MGEEQTPASEVDKGPNSKIIEKRDRIHAPTKIVCRRLPPNMTEESFLEQVSPIPEYDYFYFSKPDPSLAPNLYCRAYINFVNVEDLYMFHERFDDYVFLDDKGVEYPAIVEYAPFQKMPKKKRKKDIKCGTIESDPTYLEFLESLKEIDSDSRELKMEYSFPTEEKKETTTPLLTFLAAKKREERKRREERQRRKPKNRKDDEYFEDDIKKIKTRDEEQTDIVDYDDDDADVDGVEVVKEVVFQSKGRPKNFKEQKRFAEDSRKKSDFKKDKTDENQDDVKREKREGYKERKNFDKKEKSKFYDKKYDKSDGHEKYNKGDKKTFNANKHADKNTGKGPVASNKIKPFTSLPQLKAEELSKVMDRLDINSKKDTPSETVKSKPSDDTNETEQEKIENKTSESKPKPTEESKKDPSPFGDRKERRSSLESKEKEKTSDESQLKRHKSLDEKSDHSNKSKDGDARPERRIRNKDRPSIAIYQPGMGKYSKQRFEKEKDNTSTKTSDSTNKNSLTGSSNSVNSQD